ncbi:phosphotransferase [Promicromonospora panici]|uniref:phosphotransferase n=1 Tax=Promicromonospora panici TaxID=2219658 RepID=UPI00101C9895
MKSRLAEQAGLVRNCLGAVLCHNVFHEGNVLVAKQPDGWALTGIIDVENAVAADSLIDLAKTHYYAIHGDPSTRQAFHEGYGPLPVRRNRAGTVRRDQGRARAHRYRHPPDHGPGRGPARRDPAGRHGRGPARHHDLHARRRRLVGSCGSPTTDALAWSHLSPRDASGRPR